MQFLSCSIQNNVHLRHLHVKPRLNEMDTDSRQREISTDLGLSADGVKVARLATQRARGGANPTSALQPLASIKPKDLVVGPISPREARNSCKRYHYLKSYPGGSLLDFGIFVQQALLGVVVIGAGAFNIHRLFKDAEPDQVVCLSRLWLDDRCGRNSESRVLGIICRSLRRWRPDLKALVASSDPSVGHLGMIYNAAGFAYLGTSDGMPAYQLSDGSIHHSRTLSHRFGTHSMAHLKAQGVEIHTVPQTPKHLYVSLLDPTWKARLTRAILPYPTLEDEHGSH